jgi:ABC-type antimicrobial peptide transport system permease subunit
VKIANGFGVTSTSTNRTTSTLVSAVVIADTAILAASTIGHYIPIVLGLLERLTGHDLDPATLDQPHLLLDVPAWPPTKN